MSKVAGQVAGRTPSAWDEKEKARNEAERARRPYPERVADQPYHEMALAPGEATPEDFFREREYELRLHEDEQRWWADLERPGGRAVERYGSGPTSERAALAAMRRWQSEQQT